MINYSIIQKSQLEGALRLDAEYYQPEYLENDSFLKKHGFNKLQDLSSIDITKGETPLWRGDDYETSGFPFLRSENLRRAGLDLSNLVFVSEKVHNRMKRSKIYPGDILVAIVGATIGQTGFVSDEFKEYNTNQAIAIVRPSNKKYSCYLSIVLETKFCQLQIERLKGGGARDNLDLHEVKIIKIPVANEEFLDYCDSAVSEAGSLSRSAISYYNQAEGLLLEELGLKDWILDQVGNDMSWTVNFTEIQKASRMDAEYFQPKYEKIIERLGKEKGFLKNIAERKTELVEIESTKKYNYTEISNVNVASGEVNFNAVDGKELPANAKREVKGGELIISKVRPTRGAIAVIPDHWNKNFVVSGAFSVFEVASPLREYLQVVLRSVIGKSQMEKPTTGTSYPTIDDADVENLVIPILPQNVQQKISDLVIQSHEARKKAKELLEEAKHKVEELIEKGA